MRKRLILLPIVAGLASACVVYTSSAPSASAQQGADAKRDYNLKGFEKVDASAGVNVIVRQGPYSVHAESQNGDLSRLKVDVRGDTLVVGREQNWFGWSGRGPRYTVTVSAPDYRGFDASSGSNIDGSGLSLKNLTVEVSSGADVEIAGTCADLHLSVSSGANFDGGNLRCETASVDASSGANADAFASRSAEGEASSGADITFHGKPVNFSKDTSSGGSVRAM